LDEQGRPLVWTHRTTSGTVRRYSTKTVGRKENSTRMPSMGPGTAPMRSQLFGSIGSGTIRRSS
jgi:hypothetical protein